MLLGVGAGVVEDLAFMLRQRAGRSSPAPQEQEPAWPAGRCLPPPEPPESSYSHCGLSLLFLINQHSPSISVSNLVLKIPTTILATTEAGTFVDLERDLI